MQLPRIKYQKQIAIVFFIIFFLTVRLVRIDRDAINPDAVNWHYRSEQFMNGLKYFQLEKTFQHYHPGVTLMWIAGPTAEVIKQLTNSVYTHMTFSTFDLWVKVVLNLVYLGLTLLAMHLLTKVTNFWQSFFTLSVLSFEPFFVGNSRLFHMDILFTLLAFISIVYTFLFYKKGKVGFGILGGVGMGLAFLTRSIGIGGLLFQILVLAVNKVPIRRILWVVLPFTVSVILFFPAMWEHPIQVLVDIFSEAERVGIRKGHPQILFGIPTNDPGVVFYPLVFLLKFSPFIILGSLLALFKTKKKKIMEIFTSFGGWLFIFSFGYMLAMTISSKKIDRYILVITPMLAYYAVIGFMGILSRVKKRTMFVCVLFALFVVVPLWTYFPFYFLYINPFFGNPVSANEIIGQKPFGIGVYELKDLIVERYGEVRVGMLDFKPLEAIYPNSKVFDVRETGVSNYDVLVLAINEKTPDALEYNNTFVKDISLYINGLEYYEIYVKKDLGAGSN